MVFISELVRVLDEITKVAAENAEMQKYKEDTTSEPRLEFCYPSTFSNSSRISVVLKIISPTHSVIVARRILSPELSVHLRNHHDNEI